MIHNRHDSNGRHELRKYIPQTSEPSRYTAKNVSNIQIIPRLFELILHVLAPHTPSFPASVPTMDCD